MKKIFITYGDSNFEKSKKRLGAQVRKLGLFDDIFLYGPKDLPQYILASPLMAYNRGGGYWCWKPYVIWKTINENPDAIVVYADAGCFVQKSDDWSKWFELMETTQTVLFAYRTDFDYGWSESFGKMTVEIENWSKKECLDFFDNCFCGTEWRSFTKILGGLVIGRYPSVFIKTWLDITLFHPELIMDPLDIENNRQIHGFIEHRHDQSILTPLAFYYQNDKNVLEIISETAESDSNAGVLAKRIHDYNIEPFKCPPIKTVLIRIIKFFTGERLYAFFHSHFFHK